VTMCNAPDAPVNMAAALTDSGCSAISGWFATGGNANIQSAHFLPGRRARGHRLRRQRHVGLRDYQDHRGYLFHTQSSSRVRSSDSQARTVVERDSLGYNAARTPRQPRANKQQTTHTRVLFFGVLSGSPGPGQAAPGRLLRSYPVSTGFISLH
jgi:hypothetical protein